MLNSFVGIGRLARDAEVYPANEFPRGCGPAASFDILIDRIPEPGDTERRTDIIPCLLTGDRALTLGPFLTAGVLIGVRGPLRFNGSHLYLVVEELNFLHRPCDKKHAEQ